MKRTRRASKIAQRRTLVALAAHQLLRGYAPNLRELFQILGYRSTNSMTTHLRALRDAGMVTWTPNMSRTLAVTDDGWDSLLENECAKDRRSVEGRMKEFLRGQLDDGYDGD